MDVYGREPSLCYPEDAFPRHTSTLTTASQCATPQPKCRMAECIDRRIVVRHAEIARVPNYDGAHKDAHLRDWIVEAPPQLRLEPLQCSPEPLSHRLPKHG